MIIFEHISNKQLNKMMEEIAPIMNSGLEAISASCDKLIDAYERQNNNATNVAKLSAENGWLRAKLGLPLNETLKDIPDDIKFGDEE